jgi:hypothetical protein
VPPSVAQLEATARLAGPPEFNLRYACVTLRNPGPRVVPLYPLHRLRLDLEAPPRAAGITGSGWLPVDLMPGESHVTCVELREGIDSFRVRGQVEGAGRTYHFDVTAASPPRPLTTGPGR